MEISEIVIKNFKGIESITLSPVKRINVLIGRNNSGKSSILTCFQFLSQYFNALDPTDKSSSSSTVETPNQYFRMGKGDTFELSISITVVQTLDERQKQVTAMANAWNEKHDNPQISPDAIAAQTGDDLFGILTFDFVGNARSRNFGLKGIRTVCKDNEQKPTDVVVAEAQNPGENMRSLPLGELFIRSRPYRGYLTIWNLMKQANLENQWNLHYEHGRFQISDRHSDTIFFQDLIFPAFSCVKDTFYSTFLVSPYRHSESKALAQRCIQLNNDGRNLVQYLLNLALNQHNVFDEVADFVKSIVPEVGRLHPRFTGDQEHFLELAYDWPDGRMINLTNMGGGVEQLLILGCLLISQKTSCILWEEPESHLHPAAQEILLSELEKRVGNSVIFLTTQSPVFVRASEKVAVHAITNKDGKSATGRTLSKEDLREASAIIGSRPGHLAQADIVLYVEGKTGVAAVKEWLNKWPQRDDVLAYLHLEIQSINTDELASDDELLKALTNVNPSIILFVDCDSEPGSEEPKKSRITLQKKCCELSIPCIITDKRQIEDYFTCEAVKKGLPANLSTNFEKTYDADKTVGEQFQGGWKAYNVRIAAAMDWKDIENSKPIQSLLEAIKNYAKKLRPDWNEKTG